MSPSGLLFGLNHCRKCISHQARRGPPTLPIRKIAKYTLLTVAGFFLLIIIFAITSSVDDSLSDTKPMTATVKILPGAIEVINEDAFSWHGLIITIHDRYSTKYHFGDFNWGFLSEDSILQPQEETGAPIDGGFIDKNGKEFEGKVYTIIVGKVELEARTRADGPYDLKATFRFTADDPIFDSGITRTNKPIDATSGSHATPYPLAEGVERLPTFKVYMEEDKTVSWWVEHHEPNYLEIKEFVSDYPQDAFGSYLLPREAYQELEARFATERAAERDESSQMVNALRQHSANVDAFQVAMKEVNADRITDQQESEHICFALDQWTTQLTAARDYIEDNREAIDKKYPGISNIEHEAEEALELLSKAECQ